MSEKRFTNVGGVEEFVHLVFDNETARTLSVKQTVKKLNEQQATIQRMKHSLNTIYKAFEKHYGYDMRNAVWLIDELSYDEIVDELYIAETDSKNRKEASMYWKKKVDEQQATIRKLQDLCGESDGENAKLRIKNNEQKVLIINLQGDVNRLQYIIDELRKDNYKRFEKINELKAKLKEKEEDEKLYANEIVKLNKEAKEVLDFKSLGGDY